MDRLVHWESRLESKVFRLLDVCQAVERFSEQPFTIHYLSDESWRSHVPDVAFVDNGGMTRLMNSVGNTNLGSMRGNRANMRAAEDFLRRMGMM